MNKYILDTNSAFVNHANKKNCYISQAQGVFNEVQIRNNWNVINIDEDIFAKTKEITENPPEGLFSLLKEEGNADPFIAASAVICAKKYPDDNWLVVTKDKKLRKACKQLGVNVLKDNEFEHMFNNEE